MPYKQLEEKYAKYIGTKYAVSTNTGTSALHCAIEALNLPVDAEIIVPEFTMIASAWAVTYARLKPVFVDCTDDLLIDIHDLERKITNKTKAIMITHVYGRVCNMTDIMNIANHYGLRVIEDACEAQGASWNNKMVGSFDIGCFSFYRNKIICAEEGGAITTNDRQLAEVANDIKSMSFGAKHNYYHERLGFNYRMTNGQAILAINSLEASEQNIKNRKLVERWYNENLPDGIKMPMREVVWVYDIKHKNKNEIVNKLLEKKIAARHGFKPMSSMPMYNLDYKHLNAYKLSQEVFYLPVYPHFTEDYVKEVCNEVKKCL